MTLPARRFSHALSAALAAVLVALGAPAVAAAAEGEIIVRYGPGADARERAAARSAADVVRESPVALPRTELVTPEAGTTVSAAIAELERAPGVAYAEPNQARHAFAAPSDLRFAEQWALQNTGQAIWTNGDWTKGTAGDDINVMPVWDAGITETSATVAVIDSGVALGHPDLKGNLIPGGADFVDGDGVPADRNGHGTHVAGTIAATGNDETGVTGVAWKAPLLPIRVLDAAGTGTLEDVIAGYTYAAEHGAKVVNLSLGGSEPSQAEYDVIREAADVLFVAAAGNEGADVDATDSYPCAYDLPNVLCVAATGGSDELASFSNYGGTSVDIAAPGVDILSTYTGAAGYEWLNGTSMAAPHVAAAAALLIGQHPSGLTPWQVREMLLTSAHKAEGLAGKVATGGRLDVAAALDAHVPDATLTPHAGAVAPEPRPAPAAMPSTPAAPAPVPAQPSPAQPTRVTPPAAPASTAPAVTPAADRTAPVLGVALRGRLVLRTVLARGLRIPATCSERCTVRVAVTVDARTAKRLGLSKRAAKVRVATGTATIAKGTRKSVTVRFTAKAKRVLRRTRRVRTAVRVTATDAAGNARTRARGLTLSR
ncbi:MAG TPA: S8 family peptidase [Solirubrobacteraceae bacterium]|nr:S8 family peptidase [Solirubrobacteraceae bacterium]